MKKETYVKPQTEMIEMEATSVLASSPGINDKQGNQSFLGKERDCFWDE